MSAECHVTVYQKPDYKKFFFQKINSERNPKTVKEFRNSTCDVYLRHQREQETTYLAHSVMLAHHSDKIKDDLCQYSRIQTASDGRKIIDVPETVSQTALEAILEYIYTGNLALSPNSSTFVTQFIFALGHFQINEFMATDFFSNIRAGNITTNDNISWEKHSVDILHFIIDSRVKSEMTEESSLCSSFTKCCSVQKPDMSMSSSQMTYACTTKGGKTAVSALQEMLQKRGAQNPVYKEKESTGPPFTMFCYVEDLTTEAIGNSKKEAKHRAADKMMIKLHEDGNRGSNIASVTPTRENGSEHNLAVIDPKTVQNPVGLLQEIMQKNGYDTPEYTTGNECSPPFTNTVTFPATGQAFSGSGLKKSEAKSQAAVRMLFQLKEFGFPSNLAKSEFPTQCSHPVTVLQEFLQKRHVRAPSYDYIPHDGGSIHLKEYTCVCRVEKLDLEVKSRQKNQREARKVAASEMMTMIEKEYERP